MSPAGDIIERSAFAIYRCFIAGGVGTCRSKPKGFETPDEAAVRRWHSLNEKVRNRFRKEAAAALEAVH